MSYIESPEISVAFEARGKRMHALAPDTMVIVSTVMKRSDWEECDRVLRERSKDCKSLGLLSVLLEAKVICEEDLAKLQLLSLQGYCGEAEYAVAASHEARKQIEKSYGRDFVREILRGNLSARFDVTHELLRDVPDNLSRFVSGRSMIVHPLPSNDPDFRAADLAGYLKYRAPYPAAARRFLDLDFVRVFRLSSHVQRIKNAVSDPLGRDLNHVAAALSFADMKKSIVGILTRDQKLVKAVGSLLPNIHLDHF